MDLIFIKYYLFIYVIIYYIFAHTFSNFCFLPLRYIAKNPKFAHFPPFSATFSTLVIS